MPRKRMIDPSIWSSESFSKLSDMGRIMFVGMFSNADDEGRGRANPALLKSLIFPLDELRRVTDVKKTLEEIGSQMSITLYTLDGIDYYSFDNWKKWQKVDKPKHSNIPPPNGPLNRGGGSCTQSTTEPPPINDTSTTSTRHIPPNREYGIENKEYGIERDNGFSLSQKKFKDAFPDKAIDCKFDDSKYDIDKLIANVKASEFLSGQANITLKSCLRHYERIIGGGYRNFNPNTKTPPLVMKKSNEEIIALFTPSNPNDI